MTKSETLANWPAGRVVLFRFEAGEGLAPHLAPSSALVVCLRGRIRFDLKGKVHDLGPEQSLPMEAGDEHALRADEPSSMLLILSGA